MDNKVYLIENVSMDEDYLYLVVEQHTYRLRWDDCSLPLARASQSQRQSFEVASSGYGIHWPAIDEYLAVAYLLANAEAMNQLIEEGQTEHASGSSVITSQVIAEARASYATSSAKPSASQWIDHQLMPIARSLSPSRAAQLLDFARFLEAQSLAEMLDRENASLTDIETDTNHARWDALLASDESQALLDRLADEALAEHRAGKTKPMAFTNDGRIAPG